jgi:predicted RNase H-like HicB family nuclease
MSTSRNFHAIVYPDQEDGGFVAECPEVGTVGQGETEEAALSDLYQATEVHLMDFPLPSPPSKVTQFQIHV